MLVNVFRKYGSWVGIIALIVSSSFVFNCAVEAQRARLHFPPDIVCNGKHEIQIPCTERDLIKELLKSDIKPQKNPQASNNTPKENQARNIALKILDSAMFTNSLKNEVEIGNNDASKLACALNYIAVSHMHKVDYVKSEQLFKLAIAIEAATGNQMNLPKYLNDYTELLHKAYKPEDAKQLEIYARQNAKRLSHQ